MSPALLDSRFSILDDPTTHSGSRGLFQESAEAVVAKATAESERRRANPARTRPRRTRAAVPALSAWPFPLLARGRFRSQRALTRRLGRARREADEALRDAHKSLAAAARCISTRTHSPLRSLPQLLFGGI